MLQAPRRERGPLYVLVRWVRRDLGRPLLSSAGLGLLLGHLCGGAVLAGV